MRHPQLLSVVIVLGVMGTAMRAEAGRWKIGTGPQQCKTATGGNCYWGSDTGVNQCSCATTTAPTITTTTDPWKPVTFTGKKGTVRMTPFKTGVTNRWGVQFEAVLTFTGERVKGEVVWYNPVGSRDVRQVSHRLTGLQYTTKTVLRGLNGTRTPIYLSATTPGAPPPSWVPQPPGTLPPTGETCYYAWMSFQTQQMNCMAQHMSSFWTNAWRGAITDATVGAFSCLPVAAAGAAAGPEMSGTVYGLCIAQMVAKPFADYMIDGLFWGRGIIDQAGVPPACTADEYARARLSQACQTALP